MHTCIYEFRTYIKRVFSFSQANSMGEWLFLFLLLFALHVLDLNYREKIMQSGLFLVCPSIFRVVCPPTAPLTVHIKVSNIQIWLNIVY